MIIGNGSIAKLLNDREGFVFFAAGASDSSGVSSCDALRETSMLKSAINIAYLLDHMFVYFSSISIFLSDKRYQEHKKNMEENLRIQANHYTIIRLGNAWECTNPNTFINAYKAKPYEPRSEYKYMISKEQLNFITDNLPRTGKHEISIFGEALKVEECLKRIK